jgi:hypothetical protein
LCHQHLLLAHLFEMEFNAFTTGLPADADANRVVAMAMKLFPEFFELQELELKMDKLKWERAQLSDPQVRASNTILRRWLTSCSSSSTVAMLTS